MSVLPLRRNYKFYATNYFNMEKQFIDKLFKIHFTSTHIPAPDLVCSTIEGLLKILFPELADKRYNNLREFEQEYQTLRLKLYGILSTMREQLLEPPDVIEAAFMERLPEVYHMLIQDATAILKGDPAAVDKTEVIRTYPGFYAIAVYRLAHIFYQLSVPLIPRILTEYAHGKTGIDIHPAAQIGQNFFIDHGTGVVIGETVQIGKNVKIYQGVTLGALSISKNLAQTKRHPTIEDRVVIYSGATILGGETTVGHDSIIGGNVWLTKSVPPHSMLYHQAQVRHINKEEVVK